MFHSSLELRRINSKSSMRLGFHPHVLALAIRNFHQYHPENSSTAISKTTALDRAWNLQGNRTPNSINACQLSVKCNFDRTSTIMCDSRSTASSTMTPITPTTSAKSCDILGQNPRDQVSKCLQTPKYHSTCEAPKIM